MAPNVLLDSRVSEFPLDLEESKSTRELAQRCADEYLAADSPEFLADVNVIAHELPIEPRRAVNRVRLDDSMHAILVTGNIVCDGLLNDTPAHWRNPNSAEARLGGFVLMIWAALLGDAIGWTTQQDGRILTDVLPIAEFEQSDVSSSSRKQLSWHTEDAFSPFRADYVGLYCLRSPDGTPTTVSFIDAMTLPDRVRETLAQPRFLIRPDDAHDPHTVPTGRAHEGEAVAILTGPTEAPVLRVDRDCATAVQGDDQARAALELLFARLDANLYDLPLAPGDVCFINNLNVVHGRRPFRPRYDGRDRWLKRVNVAVDLRRTRPGRSRGDDRRIG